jgi:multiple antibiotic resistance protein
MLTVSAHASRTKILEDVLGHIGILIAVVALSISVYLSYRYAPRITEKISSRTIHGILQVIAFILLCIGVQIAWGGIRALIQSIPK